MTSFHNGMTTQFCEKFLTSKDTGSKGSERETIDKKSQRSTSTKEMDRMGSVTRRKKRETRHNFSDIKR
ncbi:unnamed protein product [Arctia plantaginis]|uniref:Uncharacterized protein n=1 Tax=Arctia plantaginis TaxID=874455 RepID=A0A8S1B213_ARCPL|nr:unnamed protein product [Arctia plantaginis]